MRGVRTYYNVWQACTNGIVKRTMQENDIKVFHHLTYGNVLWKVSSYGQRQFFIWGPAGGLETIPAEFSRHYAFKFRMIEAIRRTAVALLPVNCGFRKRCRNADLILCKTDITKQLIPASQRHKALLFTDVAVAHSELIQIEKPENGEINFLIVGRLEAWRGFDLAIEGFAKAVQAAKRIRLTIVGKGADESRLQKLISFYHLEEYVRWKGEVAMEEYRKLMVETDCVINASLKEGAVTVSFDCLAMGKPLICIDTTGYTRYFSKEYAVVIPRRHRQQVIEDLKHAIIRLADERERKRLGEKAKEAGDSFTWERRGREIRDILLNVI